MAKCGALIKQARSLVGRAVRPALLLVHSSPTLSSSRKKLDLSELLPVVARTTKQASCSSTVQGGGKRAAQTLGGWPRFLDLFSHLTTTAEVCSVPTMRRRWMAVVNAEKRLTSSLRPPIAA